MMQKTMYNSFYTIFRKRQNEVTECRLAVLRGQGRVKNLLKMSLRGFGGMVMESFIS